MLTKGLNRDQIEKLRNMAGLRIIRGVLLLLLKLYYTFIIMDLYNRTVPVLFMCARHHCR